MVKRALSHSFTFAFLTACLVLIARFAEKKTDGFSIRAITPRHIDSPDFATRSLTNEEEAELKAALSQPYTYFGCGGQAFAFFSADGRYVIKFFKQRLYHPSPIEYLWKRRSEKRLDKLQRDFFSYKVSFDELSEQTGVLYSHLQPTTHLKTKLAITDRLHIRHEIDLDRLDFVVQRRAEMVYDRVRRFMNSGNREEARATCAAVFALIRTRAELGFRDRDPNVRTNCGFIGAKAVKVDVGRFVRDSTMPSLVKDEVLRISGPFRDWISTTYPDLLAEFDEEVQNACV